MILYPRDELNPGKVDEHFRDEADWAWKNGHTCAVVNMRHPSNDLNTLSGMNNVVYRGWMLDDIEYLFFQDEARARGVQFRTGPATYTSAHEFPGWYEHFKDFTPRSIVNYSDNPALAAQLVTTWFEGPVVVKDHVKSESSDLDSFFIPDPSDTDHALMVLTNLREKRGSNFTNGFVLREWEPFWPGEIRTWWVDGTFVDYESRDGDTLPFRLPEGFAKKMKGLFDFVTADFRQRSDGTWRLIEIGDGQVSDMSADCRYSVFSALQRGV